jgi:hypothetical protein
MWTVSKRHTEAVSKRKAWKASKPQTKAIEKEKDE